MELMAALLIFSIAIATLAMALFNYTRSARADFERRAAREVAAGVIEIVDARGAGALKEGAQPYAVTLPSWKHLRGASCTVTRTTKEGACTIDVAVTWTDIFVKVRTVRLTSFVEAPKP